MSLKRKENRIIINKSNNITEKNKLKIKYKLRYFIGIFKYLLLINMFTKILLQTDLNSIYSNFSNITLTIKGTGFKNIFSQTFKFYPNEIYINGVFQTNINYTYYFTEENNNVELIWNNNNITNCHSMFSDCKDIEKIDMSSFNTSQVIIMNSMFKGCKYLVSLNLINIETSKVKYMISMFEECTSLTSLDLSYFDTSQVQSMERMFKRCKKLASLDLSNFNTSNVGDMGIMFDGCQKMTSLNISTFITYKVKYMNNMFNGCNSLTSLDLSSFDTSNVQDMSSMFAGYNSSIPLNLSNFNTSQVTSMEKMFDSSSSLTSLDLSNFETSLTTRMDNIFSECKNLKYINLNKFDDTKLINYSPMFTGVKNNIVICINKNNVKIMQELSGLCYIIYCSNDWKLNQVKSINHTSNCFSENNNKPIQYYYEFKGKYYEKCINGNLKNEINVTRCECDEEKCLKCPNESLVENLCNGCKEDNGFYPIENDNSFIENYFKCYKEPEGYYLDPNDSLYKKCYETCEICDKKGDYLNHNCLKCNFNYPYKINSDNNNYFNCYKNCSFYHYFDEQNIFHCTIDSTCPTEYPYLIIDK